MRMLGKLVHPMQPVDAERAVDHNAARHQANSANEIGVGASEKRRQMLVVQEKLKRIPAKTIARCRRPHPVAGVTRFDEMDLGFDGCIKAWQRPDFRSTFVDPPQETWTFPPSRPHICAQVGNSAEHHARIDGLNHIRRGEANRNAQGQVHKNMGLDKGSQQIVIGIKKDDIFARTRLETLLRGEALTTGFFPSHYFRARTFS